MKRLLYRNLLRPLIERVGTVAATLLVAKGFDGELVNQLVTGLTASSLIALDLLFSRLNREAD